ncbi:hypothetical protein ACFL2A_02125 [Thermodesulfobacteriota bacterium]
MPFIDILNEIVERVPNALGAIIVDYEGESVQHVSKMDEHDLKVIGAYQEIHFGTIKDSHSSAETFITKSDDMDVISMRLDDEYFVTLVLGRGAILGRAEFVLKSRLGELKALM